MKFFKRIDVICVGILIAVSVGLIVFFNIDKGGSDLIAVVTKNGEAIYSIDLNKVSKSYYLDLEDEYNIRLFVEKDGVTFVHSDCPDKICVNMGKISKDGQTAVCLPARVSVKIESNDQTDVFFTG